MKTRLLIAASILALAMLGVAPASAQVDVSPGVARVSMIHGDVSTQRGDSGDWAAAALNAPIVVGDKISTGDRSRAEVQLDYANILRLSDRSQATIAGLTRTKMQVQLGQGLADFAVFKGTEADVEIDTPNVAIRPPLREGLYRIEVTSEGETNVIVRKGELDISTPQGSTHLEKGQWAIVRGTGNETQYKIVDAPSKDDWDSWNNERNDTIRNAQAWSHTNNYYVGAEDLDAYGRWVSVPDYGMVWAPTVAVGWVPYRSGRWVWEPYWGWTWVSYEPWGWAPYHYGRWFEYGGSWVWWPGPVYGYRSYRPIWAPAYVSFFGFGGGGFGVGIGFGSVGWLPIGPCDRFYPWYGRYGRQFNTVNITNVTNITNIYNYGGRGHNGYDPLHAGVAQSNLRRALTDERFRGAVSTVPSDHFGTGRSTPVAARGDMFRQGNFMRGNLPVVPSRDSLSATNRPAAAGTMRQGEPQRFFAKTRPTPVAQNFAQERDQLQRSITQNRFTPIHTGDGANTVQARPMPQGPSPKAGTTGPDMRPGPVRAEGPGRSANAPQVRTPQVQTAKPGPGPDMRPAPQNRNDGWQRFSDRGTGRMPATSTPPRPQGNSQMRPADVGNRPTPRPEATTPAARPAEPPARNQQRNDGFQRFSDRGAGRTPAANVPPRPAEPPTRTQEPARNQDRSDGFQRFTPQPQRSAAPDTYGRGSEMGAGSSRGDYRNMGSYPQGRSTPVYRAPSESSRPPLELRRPIVTPRESRGGSGPSYSRPSGGGGGYSRPSSGGGGGNRGGGGGGSHSSGGGGSHGGGSSHSSGPHR